MSDYNYPVDVQLKGQGSTSRLGALFFVLFGLKSLALIIHMFIMFFVGLAALVVFFISQIAVLFAGSYPEGMHGFLVRVLRWGNQMSGWLWGLTDDFPPFVPGDTETAITTTAVRPERSSRLWAILTITFIKFLALIPHGICLYVLQLVQFVLVWIANLVLLFTGEYPAGLIDFVIGTLRWQTRVSAFTFGLVDEYPPFSLTGSAPAQTSPGPPPPGPATTPPSSPF